MAGHSARLDSRVKFMKYEILGKITHPQDRVVCSVKAPVPSGTGYEFEGPVRGTIELLNTGDGISARGWLQARVVLDCSRCLRPHNVSLDLEVDEVCSLGQIDDWGRDQASSEAQCPIPICDGELVDFSELVRQLLILNVPPRSLCQPDCLGLCPQCGQNLNEGHCQCHQRQVDPRLEPLKRLFCK